MRINVFKRSNYEKFMTENFSDKLPKKIVKGYNPEKDQNIRYLILTKQLETLLGLPSSTCAIYPGKNPAYEEMVREIDTIYRGESKKYPKPDANLTPSRLPAYIFSLDRTIIPLARSLGFVSIEDNLRYDSRKDKLSKKYSARNKRRFEEWVNHLYQVVSSETQDRLSNQSYKLSTTWQ